MNRAFDKIMAVEEVITMRGVLFRFAACVLAFALVAGAPQASAQATPKTRSKPAGRILKLEELTYTDIDKLDRLKTIFFLTFGNLEEHGPQNPVGSDYFQAIGFRDGLIGRLRAKLPDFTFVVVPVVPLGEGGANDLAGQHEHIGTFPVRFETLRDVAIDLGATIARKGFQNIFLIHFHGMPLHNIAFSDAAAFVSERYQTRMVNITSLVFGEGFYSPAVMAKYFGKDWEQRMGIESHAGAAETSANLYLHGELVKPTYRKLRPFVARDLVELLHTSERSGWQGYWGEPAKASRALGRDLMNDFVDRGFRIAERALAGEDLSKLPAFPNNFPPMPETAALVNKGLETYATQTAEIEAWVKKRLPATH